MNARELIEGEQLYTTLDAALAQEWVPSSMDEVRRGEGGGDNNNSISEASLSRMLSRMTPTNDWAIMTAHRAEDTSGRKIDKKENIQRNRKLRGVLDQRKMGVHQLIGHWRECSLDDVDYKDCPADKLEDVIERSYFILKPKEMATKEFFNTVTRLMAIDGLKQNVIVVNFAEGNDFRRDHGIFLVFDKGSLEKIGTDATLGKVAQAFSQHIGQQDVPFIFEGMEQPTSIGGRRMMQHQGIRYR